MKKNNVLAIACALLLGMSSVAPLCAQESGNWSMTVGADAVSSYLWRGMELGGPSIQPTGTFDYEKGDWTVCLGFWGTKTLFGDPYSEFDLFVEASWKNLTLSLTDYGYDKFVVSIVGKRKSKVLPRSLHKKVELAIRVTKQRLRTPKAKTHRPITLLIIKGSRWLYAGTSQLHTAPQVTTHSVSTYGHRPITTLLRTKRSH